MNINRDDLLREALFQHMDKLVSYYQDVIPASALRSRFEYDGIGFQPLQQVGIFKPGLLGPKSAAVVLVSSIDGPYTDKHDLESGVIEYHYQGKLGDEDNHHNRSLRAAMEQRRPMLYLCGIAPNMYLPLYPVFAISDNRTKRTFDLVVGDRTITVNIESSTEAKTAAANAVKSYATIIAKRRIHQSGFRQLVIGAYQSTCAMCRLKIPTLLDAAHIIPDSEEGGDAVVQNGLALCKIHHAAYDARIIGVSPDYVMETRPDILNTTDGPMLAHGLQGLHGKSIHVPRFHRNRPDKDRLNVIWQRYLKGY